MYVERKRKNGESYFIMRMDEEEKIDFLESVEDIFPPEDIEGDNGYVRWKREDKEYLLSLINSLSHNEKYDKPNMLSAIISNSQVTRIIELMFDLLIIYSMKKMKMSDIIDGYIAINKQNEKLVEDYKKSNEIKDFFIKQLQDPLKKDGEYCPLLDSASPLTYEEAVADVKPIETLLNSSESSQMDIFESTEKEFYEANGYYPNGNPSAIE